MPKIVVVGAGAAGYFAAITAKETNPNVTVCLVEGAIKPLTKVLISGGGRCNVTHNMFDIKEMVKRYPRGSKELRGVFSRFQASDTVAWFEDKGVAIKSEADGRMFPVSDSSQSIYDCLESQRQELGIELLLKTKIKKIKKSDNLFELETLSKKIITADKVLLATGGSRPGHALAQSLGHNIVNPVPSLFTFKIKDPRLDTLMGLSFEDIAMNLKVDGKQSFKDRGPLLITHWGLSGPTVIRLSAWAAPALFKSSYQATLVLNFLPDKNPEMVLDELKQYKNKYPTRMMKRGAIETLPKRYWNRILDRLSLPESQTWSQLSNEAILKIRMELCEAEFCVTAKGEFKEEFVTCGGVRLKEVDFKSMQSKTCPGLYLAGELLDVDGITGGFNFQSAWSTGFLAGRAMASD